MMVILLILIFLNFEKLTLLILLINFVKVHLAQCHQVLEQLMHKFARLLRIFQRFRMVLRLR